MKYTQKSRVQHTQKQRWLLGAFLLLLVTGGWVATLSTKHEPNLQATTVPVDERPAHIIVDDLITLGYFTRPEFDAWLSTVTFEEVLSHFSRNDLAELFIKENFMYSSVTSTGNLLYRLSTYGIHPDVLQLRPKGLISAISDTGNDSILFDLLRFRSGFSWINKLMLSHGVLEELETMFESGREEFIEYLSGPSLLELLGADTNNGEIPEIDEIYGSLWYAYIFPPGEASYHIEGNYLVDPAPLYMPAGTYEFTISAEYVAAELAALPDGHRDLLVNGNVFQVDYDSPDTNFRHLDPVRDINGNIIWKEPPAGEDPGVPYYLPLRSEWIKSMTGRLLPYISELSEFTGPFGLDRIILDYEDTSGTRWEYQKQFYEDGIWDFSPLLQDPRTPSLLQEMQITESDLLSMNTWDSYGEKRMRWNTYLKRDRAEALNKAIVLPFRKYFPDAISSNFHYELRTELVPDGGFSNYDTWGRGVHIAEKKPYGGGTLPSKSFYGRQWTTRTPDTVFDEDPNFPMEIFDPANPSKGFTFQKDPPGPISIAEINDERYITLFNALVSQMNRASVVSAATEMRTMHWLTPPQYLDKPEYYDGYFGPTMRYDTKKGYLQGIEDVITFADGTVINDGTDGNPVEVQVGTETFTFDATEPDSVLNDGNDGNPIEIQVEEYVLTFGSGTVINDGTDGNPVEIRLEETSFTSDLGQVLWSGIVGDPVYMEFENQRGPGIGNVMAESWYRTAADTDTLLLWNSPGKKYPESVEWMDQTLTEINEIFGYADREILTDGWVEWNGVRTPVGAVRVSLQRDAIVWGAKANNQNIYRVILHPERMLPGQDRFDPGIIINDGTDGNPVEIHIGSDVIRIQDAQVYIPQSTSGEFTEGVSKQGLWVVQDTHAGDLLTETMEKLNEDLMQEPEIIFTVPVPEHTNQTPLEVRYTVDGGSENIVSFDLDEGYNRLEIRETNELDNETVVILDVFLDTIDGVIEIDEQTPEVTRRNPFLVSYRVDREESQFEEFTLTPGNNSMTINAPDLAGNMGSLTFNVFFDERTNDEIADTLVTEGHFAEIDYIDFINSVTFEEVISHFSREDLMSLLLNANLPTYGSVIRPDITTTKELREALIEKGIDIDRVKLRSLGLISGIGDIRMPGSLFVDQPNFTETLMMGTRVTEDLKLLFESDRTAFLEYMDVPSFVELLGAESLEKEIPIEDDILLHTWRRFTGPYVVDPAGALWRGNGSPYQDIWSRWHGTVPDSPVEEGVQPIADRLNELPEGQKVMFIHSWSYGLRDDTTREWSSQLDPLVDSEGNIVWKIPPENSYGDPPIPHYFPSRENWIQEMNRRLEPLAKGLKEAAADLETIMFDYEEHEASRYYFMLKKYEVPIDVYALWANDNARELLTNTGLTITDLIEADHLGLDTEKWDTAEQEEKWKWFEKEFKDQEGWTAWSHFFWNYDFTPLMEDPRTIPLGNEIGVDISTMATSTWGHNSIPQILWDSFMIQKRTEGLERGIYSVFQKYYPDLISYNYSDKLSTEIIPYTTSIYLFSGFSTPWGLGSLAEHTLPSRSFYPRAPNTPIVTPEGAAISLEPLEYPTIFNAIRYMLQRAQSGAGTDALHTQNWGTYPDFANNNGPFGVAETDMGTEMADTWYLLAPQAKNMSFWNASSDYTDDGNDLANQIMAEVNEVFGFDDRDFLMDGWVELNGVRTPVSNVNIDPASDIAFWGARANGKNIYRVILNEEVFPAGQDRFGADVLINDGTDGNPFEVHMGTDVLRIPHGEMYIPTSAQGVYRGQSMDQGVGPNGFWVMQDPSDIDLLTENTEVILNVLKDSTPIASIRNLLDPYVTAGAFSNYPDVTIALNRNPGSLPADFFEQFTVEYAINDSSEDTYQIITSPQQFLNTGVADFSIELLEGDNQIYIRISDAFGDSEVYEYATFYAPEVGNVYSKTQRWFTDEGTIEIRIIPNVELDPFTEMSFAIDSRENSDYSEWETFTNEYFDLAIPEDPGAHNLHTRVRDASGTVREIHRMFVYQPRTEPDPSYDSDPLNMIGQANARGEDVIIIDRNNPNCANPPSGNLGSNVDTLNSNTTPFCSFGSLNETGPQYPRIGDSLYNENTGKWELQRTSHIYIRGGTYITESFVRLKTNGAEDKKIHIEPYPGEDVTIRTGVWLKQWGIESVGDYIVWGAEDSNQGSMTFIGHTETPEGRVYSPILFSVSGDNTLVRNITFRHNLIPAEGIIEGMDPELVDIAFWDRTSNTGPLPPNRLSWGRLFRLQYTKNSVVQDSHLEPMPFLENYMNHHEITIGNSDGENILCDHCENVTLERLQMTGMTGHQAFSIRESTDIVVQDSDITNLAHSGIAMWRTTSGAIRNNVIHEWSTAPINLAASGNGIQISGCNNIIIENNVIRDSIGNGNALSIGQNRGEIPDARLHQITVQGNIIYNPGRTGIFVGHYGGRPSEDDPTITDIDINNNILFGVRHFVNADNEIVNEYATSNILLNLKDPNLLEEYNVNISNNVFGNFSDETVVGPVVVKSRFGSSSDTINYITGDPEDFPDESYADLNSLPSISGNTTINPLDESLEGVIAEANILARPVITILDPTPTAYGVVEVTETPLTVKYKVDNGSVRTQTFDLQDGHNTLIIEATNLAGLRKISALDVVYDDGIPSPLCHTNSDPLGLADGTSVLFIDQNNCNCSDEGRPIESTRERALNPETPLCSVRALREYNGPYDPENPGSNIGLMHPGDTVMIRGGEYILGTTDMHIWSSGTNEQPITIQPYPNEHVTIRAGSTGYQWEFTIDGDNVIIDDLELIGYKETPVGNLYAPLMVLVNGDNVHLKNVTVRENQGFHDDIGHGQRESDDGTEYGRGIALNGVANILVEDTEVICGSGMENYERHVSPTIEGIMCDNCTNAILNRVAVNRCGHGSIQIKYSRDTIIENSDIQNDYHTGMIVWRSTGSIIRNNRIHHWNYGSSNGNGIQLQASNNSRIYNNLFYDAKAEGHAISVGGEVSSGWNTDDNLVYNNTFHDTGTVGIIVNHYSGGTNDAAGNHIHGNKIFNNIIYGVGYEGTFYEEMRNPLAFGFLNRETAGSYGNEFTNNILHHFDDFVGGNEKIVGERFDPTQRHIEYTIDEFNALQFASGNIDTDPLLLDPGNVDFTLQAGSPAAFATTCPADLTEDFFGNPRNPSNCAIGAIEEPDTIPPVIEITDPNPLPLITNQSTLTVTYTADGIPQLPVSFNLSEGINNLEIRAEDTVGNESIFAFSVELDTIPPLIEVTGALLTQTNTTPLVVEYSVNGVLQIPLSFDLIEGPNNLEIYAEDAAGNESVFSFSVELDTEAPTVEITSTIPAVTNQTPLVIEYSVDDIPETPLSFDLTEGMNDLEIRATDGASNESIIIFTVELDTTAPSIVVTSVIPSITNETPLVVSYTTDGTEKEQSFDLFEGQNTLEIRESDTVGNEGIFTFTVNLDTTGPDIVITSVIPAITDQSSLIVEYTMDGVPQVPLLFNLIEGVNLIEIRRSDALGNETVVQYEVILSIDAPEIIILSEVPTVTNHSPIIINYTVNEEPRTQTFVLVEGVNTITIREANVLGEETVITFDVELDTIGPSIEIISNVPEITELSELNVVYEVDGVTKSETFILRPGDNVIFITESDAAGNQTTVTLEIEMTEEDEEEQTDVTPPPTIPHTIYYYDDSDVITENDIKHARAAQELLLQKYFEKKNAETNSGATVHTAAPESQSSEYSAAQALVIRGIMRGQGNSTANLDLGNKVNRAEIVTMATRLLTLTTPVDQKTLKDISDDSWYKDAVSASIEEGLIQGYPDGTFRGENPVTIVEIIKIASIAAGVASQNDEKSGTLWYEQYVRKAENSGLLSGLPIVQLGAPATRGWVAQILFNADQMIRNR